MDLVGPRHMQSGIAVWKCLLRVHQACFLCISLHLTCCFPSPSVLACLLSFPGHQEQKRVDGTTREVKKVRKARNRRQEWNMMAYDKELRPDNRLSQSVHHGASSEGSLSPDTRCVHVMDPSPHVWAPVFWVSVCPTLSLKMTPIFCFQNNALGSAISGWVTLHAFSTFLSLFWG